MTSICCLVTRILLKRIYFVNYKHKTTKELEIVIIYKIPRSKCDKVHIGQTWRYLKLELMSIKGETIQSN